MDMLFADLLKATTPSGDIDSIQYGLVADIRDPLKLGRVQVYDSNKGGKYKSDWLMRALPFTSFTPPVPTVGDLVVFGYINGDPHTGCYLGVIVNNVNKPVGKDTDITISLGSTVVLITLDGIVSIKGAKEVNVEATKVNVKASETLVLEGKSIEFKGTDSVKFTSPSVNLGNPGTATLAGKDLVVKGATDSRGDSITVKGW